MALHPEFPESPYAELDPEHCWFPAAEELRETAYEKLLLPLVARIRMVRGIRAHSERVGYPAQGEEQCESSFSGPRAGSVYKSSSRRWQWDMP